MRLIGCGLGPHNHGYRNLRLDGCIESEQAACCIPVIEAKLQFSDLAETRSSTHCYHITMYALQQCESGVSTTESFYTLGLVTRPASSYSL